MDSSSMDYLSPSIHSHCLLVTSFLNWKIHGWVHSGEISWSNLKVFLPHLSIPLLMLKNINQRAEAANQRVWRVHALELGTFKQGIFLRGQHWCWLPAACPVSSSSPLSLYIWLNWSQSSGYNLQPSILRDINTYFRLLKMFLRSHYWD